MPGISAPTELSPRAAADRPQRLRVGVGVFDSGGRLSYCNAAFWGLRDLSDAFCRPGTSLVDILAASGGCGPGWTGKTARPLAAVVAPTHACELEEETPTGRRLLVSYTPVPGEGLIITCSEVTEPSATERKLRESEERYALVSEAVAEGIYDWDIERNSLFVSPRLMEIFGFEGPGLNSADWFALVHAEDRNLYRGALRECFKGTTARLGCEYRILVRSGEYRWVEDHGLPVRDSGGRAIRLVGAVGDVTGRKQTERALRESKERHELALQAINESVYEWDIVSGAMYYSPRLQAALGLTPEELRTSEDWISRIHPQDLPRHRNATRSHLKAETERLEIEYRYRHADGTWHWARQHGVALRDDHGRAVRLAGSTGDITAEKRMAEELDKARRQLQDAIEAAAEGFVLFDPQDRIVMCNSRYRSFFEDIADQVRPGNSFESIIRSAVSRGMFPDAGADPEGWLAAVLERRRHPAGPRETRLANGVHLQVSDYMLEDGSRVSVHTNITDLRRRQDELTEAKAEIESALQQLTEALDQQTATADVLKVISRSTFDIQAVLGTLVDSAARLCQAENAQIFLRDGEVYCLAAHNGFSPEYQEYARQHPIAPGRGTLVARTALEGAPVHMPDVLADPEYSWHEGRTLAGFRAMLGVPLQREGSCVGVMAMTRAAPEPFTDRQIELVTTFADQAVIAIENVRLFEEVQARTAELQESLEYQTATSDVLNVISRSPNELQPVLDAIVQTAAQLCSAEYAFIARPYDGTCHLAAANNVELAHIQFISRNPVAINRDSILGRVALDCQTIHAPDVLADPEFKRPDWQEVGRQRTVLGVPLMREGMLLGVIILARTEVRPFTEKQIDLVTTFADQAVIAINNVGLFEEVQARTAELQQSLEYQTATSDVLSVISRSPSQIQPVLDTIVATAAQLCDAERAFIYRYDGVVLRHQASHNASPELKDFVTRNPISPGRHSGVGRAAVEKLTIHIPDVQTDAEYTFGAAHVDPIRTVLAVPMLKASDLVGVLVIYRLEVRPFTDKQIELVTTFADQAVIAIENVRLFEEVEARTRELTESLEQQTATSQVLQAISRSTFDLQAVLETLVQSAARLCEADIGTITRQKESVYFRAALYGFPPDFADRMSRVPVELNRGTVTGRTLIEGSVVHVEDVTADTEYEWAEAQQAGQFRTLLGVPLLRHGTPIGAMALGRRAVCPFTERQIELVRTFADQAVIAIENVRLFDEVQARTRELARSVGELRALGEVSHAVNSTLDLETVLSTIVTKAVQLSATEAGAIYVFSKLRQKFRLRATYGMSEAMIAEIGKQSVGLGTPYIGSATNSGEAVQVSDLTTEPPSPIRDLILGAGYRALLVVPLLRPGRIVGALVVRRKEPGLFPNSTIDLLQTFAAQSVLAIQNARLFEDVETRTRELAKSLDELRAAQERLVQTEKLASLGQLTAGIAHEIKNPLNFVNNFAALSIELIDELNDTLRSTAQDQEQTAELMELLAGNLRKVVQHGKRADSIVKNMLLHSRAGSGERRLADINALVEESLNLAYHGARAEKQGFNVTIERSFDPSAGEVDVLPQEITRVFLNLISNGFYATAKRKEGADSAYEPTLLAATRKLAEAVEIRIRDNGTGMPPEVKEKMFNPFFTTKPAGEGTGLGLSLSHDIVVKQHGGSIEVDTSPGEYTEFRIVLPRSMVSPADEEVTQ